MKTSEMHMPVGMATANEITQANAAVAAERELCNQPAHDSSPSDAPVCTCQVVAINRHQGVG